jgi:hypothetical protein
MHLSEFLTRCTIVAKGMVRGWAVAVTKYGGKREITGRSLTRVGGLSSSNPLTPASRVLRGGAWVFPWGGLCLANPPPRASRRGRTRVVQVLVPHAQPGSLPPLLKTLC